VDRSSAAYTPPQGALSLEAKLVHNSNSRAMLQPQWGEVRIVMRERDRYRKALEHVLPLVVDLSERGWIKGAEAAEIIREALGE